jgi:hypothetical protein
MREEYLLSVGMVENQDSVARVQDSEGRGSRMKDRGLAAGDMISVPDAQDT